MYILTLSPCPHACQCQCQCQCQCRPVSMAAAAMQCTIICSYVVWQYVQPECTYYFITYMYSSSLCIYITPRPPKSIQVCKNQASIQSTQSIYILNRYIYNLHCCRLQNIYRNGTDGEWRMASRCLPACSLQYIGGVCVGYRYSIYQTILLYYIYIYVDGSKYIIWW